MRKLKWGLLVFALVLAGCGDTPEEVELRKAELAKEATIEAAKIAAETEIKKAEMAAATEAARLEKEAEWRQNLSAEQEQSMQAIEQNEMQLAQEQAENQLLQQQAIENAQIQATTDYGPVQPGDYQNHYGNPAVGQWTPNGQFVFNDPLGSAAQATNNYLLAAGLGGLAGYMASKAAMRGNWERENHDGYKPWHRRFNGYTDRYGNSIDANRYHAYQKKHSSVWRNERANMDIRIQKLEAEKRALREKSLRQKQELRRQQAANLKKKQELKKVPAAKLMQAQAAKAKQAQLKKYYAAGGAKVPAQGTLYSKKNVGPKPNITKVYTANTSNPYKAAKPPKRPTPSSPAKHRR